MKRAGSTGESPDGRGEKRWSFPGIVIADGGMGGRALLQAPRVRAFVYGEELPSSPTLPFGRWKRAS